MRNYLDRPLYGAPSPISSSNCWRGFATRAKRQMISTMTMNSLTELGEAA